MHSDLLSQSLLWDNICASTLFPNSFSWGITTLCRFRIYFLIVTPVSLVSRWLRLLVPALEFTPWTVNSISFLENYVLRDIQHCDVGRRDGSWQKRRGKWVISGLEHTDRENNSTKVSQIPGSCAVTRISVTALHEQWLCLFRMSINYCGKSPHKIEMCYIFYLSWSI